MSRKIWCFRCEQNFVYAANVVVKFFRGILVKDQNRSYCVTCVWPGQSKTVRSMVQVAYNTRRLESTVIRCSPGGLHLLLSFNGLGAAAGQVIY